MTFPFDTTPVTRGFLTLTIVGARNLYKNDLAGHNDVYIEYWFEEDIKRQTDPIKYKTNPIWNATGVFEMTYDSKDMLHFKVFNNNLTDKTNIGEGALDVYETYNSDPFDGWVELSPTGHGEVHFKASFEDSNNCSSE